MLEKVRRAIETAGIVGLRGERSTYSGLLC